MQCLKTREALSCKLNDVEYYFTGEELKKIDFNEYTFYECSNLKEFNVLCKRITDENYLKGKKIYYLIANTEHLEKIIVNDKMNYYILFDKIETLSKNIEKIFEDKNVMAVNMISDDYFTNKQKTPVGFIRDDVVEKSIFAKLFTYIEYIKQQEGKIDYSQYYLAILKEEKKKKKEISENLNIFKSKIYTNLKWKYNSCWMDCLLVNIFSQKTSLSAKFEHKILEKYTSGNEFDKFMYNLLFGNNEVSIMNVIDTIQFICVSLDQFDYKLRQITNAYCNIFTKGAFSSPSPFLIFLQNYYGLLPLNYIYIGKIEGVSFEHNFDIMLSERKDELDYFIVESFDYYKQIVKPPLEKIYMNKKYRLLSATVSTPGHYVSIVYDTTKQKYITINKLNKTTITDVSKNDWNQTTLLFYYLI